MAQGMISARIDINDKNRFDAFCSNVGLSTSAVINLFVKKVLMENRIPFEITGTPDNQSLSEQKEKKSNFSRVSDFRKDDLEAVLKILPESVDELWVFGSSVTPYCKPTSDLDVCLIGDDITHDELKTIFSAPRHAMDLLHVSHAEFDLEKVTEGTVYHEIATKGLMIYKKGVGIVNE